MGGSGIFQALLDWAVVAGILAAVVGAIAVMTFKHVTGERSRRKPFRSWAEAHGWRYRESDPDMARVISGHYPFDTGYRPTGRDVVFSEVEGREVFAFDFQFRPNEPVAFGVLLVDTRGAVPFLDIQAKRGSNVVLGGRWSGNVRAVVSRWAEKSELLHDMTVNVGSAAPTVFGQMYRVDGDDDTADAILTPRVEGYLVSAGADLLEPSWRFDNGLLVVVARTPWHTGDIERYSRAALGLLDLIPDGVFQPTGLPPGRYHLPEWDWRHRVRKMFDKGTWW